MKNNTISIIMLLIMIFQISKATEKIIKTPFGHQPTKTYSVLNELWDADELERCWQGWLYSGGIFKSVNGTTFTEKNNYLTHHGVLCLELDGNNIYIGTDEGIYLSTDYGENWLDADDDNIDNLDQLEYKVSVNALSYSSDNFIAGTDHGIFVSQNGGETWDQYSSNMNITCITRGDGNNNIYIGTNTSNASGVYKSTNGGNTWAFTNFSNSINCIKYIHDASGDIIFAGTSSGLFRYTISTDDGNDWVELKDENFSGYFITSLHYDGTNIFIGSKQNGCWISTDSGSDFIEKNGTYPSILPKKISGENYQLNSLIEYEGFLYAATDNELYRSALPNLSSWEKRSVLTEGFHPSGEVEIKMIFRDNNNLWFACKGGEYYNDAIVIKNPPDPYYYGNYNCHAYAWHISEGGISKIQFDSPLQQNYVSTYYNTETNWDYIKANNGEDIELNDVYHGRWDKINYGWNHSGIKCEDGIYPPPPNEINPFEYESIWVISKWSMLGPLIKHKLMDNPYSCSINNLKFWKSKKNISGEINNTIYNNDHDVMIGRQITTEGETIIPSTETANFRITPMENHFIHLSNGFHAERGSNFHAWVDATNAHYDQTTGKPTWETDINKIKEKPNTEHTASGLKVNEKSFNLQHKPVLLQNMNPIFISLPHVKDEIKADLYNFSGKGSGTIEDPYQITNVEQLQELAYDFDGNNYYKLMNDIDATETRNWNKFDDDHNPNTPMVATGFRQIHGDFQGSLDGGGHVIKNLYMYHPQDNCVSLFNTCVGVIIKNLGLINVDFTGYYPGGFCRCGDEGGFIIENCFLTGKLTSKSPYYPSVGFGLITNGSAKNCFTECTLTSDSLASNFTFLLSDKGRVINCYAAGKSTSKYVISPFGYDGHASSSFWDNETIIVTDSLGIGTGLPTSAMMKRATFEAAGWDFDSTWYIDEGMDYPRLQVFRHDTTSIVSSRKSFDFNLDCNPNPAENIVNLDFSVSQYCPVSITVSNSLGMKVALVINQKYYSEGSYRQAFDTSALPPGVYFCTLQTPEFTITKQFVVVK